MSHTLPSGGHGGSVGTTGVRRPVSACGSPAPGAACEATPLGQVRRVCLGGARFPSAPRDLEHARPFFPSGVVSRARGGRQAQTAEWRQRSGQGPESPPAGPSKEGLPWGQLGGAHSGASSVPKAVRGRHLREPYLLRGPPFRRGQRPSRSPGCRGPATHSDLQEGERGRVGGPEHPVGAASQGKRRGQARAGTWTTAQRRLHRVSQGAVAAASLKDPRERRKPAPAESPSPGAPGAA